MTTGKSLQIFGGSEEINTMTKRLTSAMQGTRALQPKEAYTLAQISVAHGLDPFNGEVWFIPGSGVMVGVKGLRKMARNQIVKEGGEGATFWTEFERINDPTEFGEAEDTIIVKCVLKDSLSIDQWVDKVKKLTELEFSLERAEQIAGRMPTTIGYGIVTKDDPSKMKKALLAHKRAEADALKKRFDVSFLIDLDSNGEMPDLEIIEAEVVEHEPRTAAQASAELGFGFKIEQIDLAIQNTHIEDEITAHRFLINSNLGLNAKDEDIIKFCKAYMFKMDDPDPKTKKNEHQKAAFDYAKENWNK